MDAADVAVVADVNQAKSEERVAQVRRREVAHAALAQAAHVAPALDLEALAALVQAAPDALADALAAAPEAPDALAADVKSF